MHLSEIHYEGVIPVDGYGPGFFRLGGQVLHGPVIIGPNAASSWDGASDVQSLVDLAADVDVVLFGTGPDMTPVPADLREALEAAGMGLEPMNSASACRTYNILAAEGRRVALAALPL